MIIVYFLLYGFVGTGTLGMHAGDTQYDFN